MSTKPAETEYVVQWFNPAEGWCDLEGAESETKAHQAARRFYEQDAVLGVEKPRYRVVTISTVDLASDDEVAAARDERDGFPAAEQLEDIRLTKPQLSNALHAAVVTIAQQLGVDNVTAVRHIASWYGLKTEDTHVREIEAAAAELGIDLTV